MSKAALLAGMVLLCLALCYCKSEVETKPVVFSTEPPREEELCLATMDAILLDGPSVANLPMVQVRDGDHLTLIKMDEKWCKVTHTVSGMTGWLHSGALAVRKQSRYWSGDTEKARATANVIYLKEELDPLKLSHVKINEWSRTVTFYSSRETPLEEKEALKIACQWYDRILDYFPDWQDKSIVFVAYTDTEQYTILCHGEKDTDIINRTPLTTFADGGAG